MKSMMSKTYRVVWEIDIDADTPLEAAKEAISIQRDKGSEATCFYVVDSPEENASFASYSDMALGHCGDQARMFSVDTQEDDDDAVTIIR